MDQYDFRIEGVYNDGRLSERLEFLISEIFEDRGFAGEILEHDHKLGNDGADECVAHIRLSYDGECGVTDANEALVRDFCYALLHDNSAEGLQMISSYGVLGFSSGGNAVGQIWNLIAVQAMLRNGGALLDAMMEQKTRPSPEKDAEWIQAARMVASTALSHCFGLDSSLNEGETAESLFDKIDRMGELSANKERTAEGTITYLRKLTLTKRQVMSEGNRLRDARIAYDTFHDISARVCKRIEDTQGSIMPKAVQRELLAELLDLQVCACQLFSSTEDLLNMYESWFIQHAATAVCNFIDAGVVGTQAMAALKAAGAFKNTAVTIMQNIPKEGMLTQVGRWAGVVTSETPLQVAKQQAAVATAGATILRGVGYANAGLAAYSLGKGALQSYHAAQSFKKRNACENLAKHSMNTAILVLHCRTAMVWVNVVGGKVQFIGEARSEFERYVRASYPGSPDAKQLTPESVMDELRNRAKWLKKYGTQIRSQHKTVFITGV